jgi:hypothetical protein
VSATLDITTARCEALISTLAIPDPFDMGSFLTSVAERRGKPIKLISTIPGAGQMCGMLISTTEVDYIYSSENLSPLQAQHTKMHEVGHLLFGHGTRESGAGTPDLAESLHLLLPTLSAELVRHILGRTAYATEQEREAELFASLVLAPTTGAWRPTLGDLPARERIHRATRRLTPLWQLVTNAFPHVQLDAPPLSRAARSEYRLYRRVLEIRDAQLALRPYIPPEASAQALAASRERNLDPLAADVLLEAMELAAALNAYRTGQPPHPEFDNAIPAKHSPVPPDLLAEAQWLTKVASTLHYAPDARPRPRNPTAKQA